MSNVIYFKSASGEDLPFELLDVVPFEGKEYAVLLPEKEYEEDEEMIVHVFEIIPGNEDDEDETYLGVEDEDLLNQIFEVFTERNQDNFEG